jgi:N-formylglutamate amidohydrolase
MGTYPPPTVHPPRRTLPVLLSVPHSGTLYGDTVLANAVQGRRALESLEDPLVDRLAWRAIAAGFGAVVQRVPRAIIDCNRDEDELDPASVTGCGPVPFGPRARHGLGLIPSRTQRHGQLWRKPIDRAELDRRIGDVHRPYHAALAEQLQSLVAVHGEAILFDCHSMPPRRDCPADLVIGDRHGSSAAPWLTAEAARLVRAAGFRVALNDPYAGGAIVARHGRPDLAVHALQLEINRAAYLEKDGRNAGVGFDRIASLIELLASGLGQAIFDRQLAEAAE